MASSLSVVDVGRIFWLRTDKVNTKGFCPVSLRLTLRGYKPAEVGTGVRCRPVDWAGPDKNGPLKKSHPEYSLDSQTLETLRLNVKVAAKRLEAMGLPVTPAAVADFLKNPASLTPQPDPCLLTFMEGELEASYKKGNRATYEAVRAVVRKLRAWHGPTALPAKALPPERVQAFYQHLLAATARGGEISTANKAIINLTALYRRGVKQRKWAEANNPFTAVEKKRDLKRQKVRLTKAEHDAVRGLDLSSSDWLWRSRAVYLTQFFLRGERIGACLLLQWTNLHQNETSLRYQAQKGGPYKQVEVPRELKDLFQQLRQRDPHDLYILPFLPRKYAKLDAEAQLSEIKKATALINKGLRKIAGLAGIDKPLRSHAARHTFGTLARKSLGVAFVQQAFGHATERMTQVYLAEFDHDELDAAANTFFDSL